MPYHTITWHYITLRCIDTLHSLYHITLHDVTHTQICKYILQTTDNYLLHSNSSFTFMSGQYIYVASSSHTNAYSAYSQFVREYRATLETWWTIPNGGWYLSTSSSTYLYVYMHVYRRIQYTLLYRYKAALYSSIIKNQIFNSIAFAWHLKNSCIAWVAPLLQMWPMMALALDVAYCATTTSAVDILRMWRKHRWCRSDS